MFKVEWEWGYYGKCFIDGKFSHGVRINPNYEHTNYNGQYWDNCPEPGGLMLGTLKQHKTLESAVREAEEESLRITRLEMKSLKEMRRTLKEYPFAK